jgi:hypothetical protein
MTAAPKVGEPRMYPGDTIPILYPGEVATAQLNFERITFALQTGERVVPVTHWIVEPAPGWYHAWLRWQYRVRMKLGLARDWRRVQEIR